MRQEKGRKTTRVGLISFVLVLIMLISVLPSCSLLEEKPSRAFENLDAETDAPLIKETEENIPSDSAELSETARPNIQHDRPVISKGTVPVFTTKNNPGVKNDTTDDKANQTGPTKAVTPTPTPTPTPQAPRLSSNVGAVHAGPPYTIRVFIAEQRVVVYGTTASGAEVPIRKMVTSTGVRSHPTPLTGESNYYYLGGGVPWVSFSKYKPTTYHQYATRFYGKGLGPHFYFHSTAYSKMRDPSSLQVGVFNRLGRRASHGCIRLNTADAKFIYSLRGTRSKVKILANANGYNIGSVPGLPKFTIKVKRGDPRYGWDPYDPNPNNPWKNHIDSPPRIIGTAQTITAGAVASFDYLKDVKAYDFTNTEVEVTYTGSVDVNTAGTYPVIYTAKDETGNTSTLTLQHVVNPAPTSTPTPTAVPTTAPPTSTPTPTQTPKPPTPTPKPPTPTPDPPSVTPDPPSVTPDPPSVTPDPPSVTPDPPSVTPDP